MGTIWDAGKTAAFRRRLQSWYETQKRPLPWRSDPTPYRVWISEIMLQQTQTETVLRYYDRFLRRFPDVNALARASEGELLRFWAGLGYYRRARNLHKAARLIAAEHKSFPKEFSTILSLPGIGRYTAGAICSIAYNQPYPVVDGNIRRVVSRIFGLTGPVAEKFFWNVMSTWIRAANPSSFNQGMMELGARICTPVHPGCLQCPVRDFCGTGNLGAEIPTRPRRTRAVKRIHIVVLVLECRGCVLISKMEGSGPIPGRWGLPWEIAADPTAAKEIAVALGRRLTGRDVPLAALQGIRHTITQHRITISGFHGRCAEQAGVLQASAELHWMRPSSAERFLTSSLFHKVLAQSGRFPKSRA